MIAGLLLAAGRSERFGADKLLAALGGRALLSWSADALAAETDALYLVVPDDARGQRRASALGDRLLTIIHAPGHDTGMGDSLAAGVRALPRAVDAVVVALGDQPAVSPRVVRLLGDRWRAGGVHAVVPRYLDGRGHPVLFDRHTFDALAALQGDRGARLVLDSLGNALALVVVDQSAPRDVDTPAALHSLAIEWENEREPPSAR